ncbi:VapC toxin family PIN domain ribonuclease, partial [Burkholderia multivorans]
NGLIVATRDVAPFEAAGLRVIDPWASQGAPVRQGIASK